MSCSVSLFVSSVLKLYLFSCFRILYIYLQVSLLNQEAIVEKIQSAFESKLRNSNEERTFQEQVCGKLSI